jgi:RNA polymerase sigma-70 factor (ECF subfamily)
VEVALIERAELHDSDVTELEEVGGTDAPVAPASGTSLSAKNFRALYQANVAFVWRNLRRLGVWPNELEDRTQEVFLVAFRRLNTFEERGFGVRAWLFQILLRVASDARRHRRRHPEDATSDVEAHVSGQSCDPCDLVERRRAIETLDRALETIDVNRRAVLVLHEIEEMSAPEIGRILEIPVNTVYSRLRVGRAELELALRTQRPGGER